MTEREAHKTRAKNTPPFLMDVRLTRVCRQRAIDVNLTCYSCASKSGLMAR